MPILFNDRKTVIRLDLDYYKKPTLYINDGSYFIYPAVLRSHLQECIDWLDKVETNLTVFGEKIFWDDPPNKTGKYGVTEVCVIDQLTFSPDWRIKSAGPLQSLGIAVANPNLSEAIKHFEDAVNEHLDALLKRK